MFLVSKFSLSSVKLLIVHSQECLYLEAKSFEPVVASSESVIEQSFTQTISLVTSRQLFI